MLHTESVGEQVQIRQDFLETEWWEWEKKEKKKKQLSPTTDSMISFKISKFRV